MKYTVFKNIVMFFVLHYYQAFIFVIALTQNNVCVYLRTLCLKKPNFAEDIKNITQKIGKTMGLLRRFHPIRPRSSLLAMYKTFIRSQLDFADVRLDFADVRFTEVS